MFTAPRGLGVQMKFLIGLAFVWLVFGALGTAYADMQRTVGFRDVLLGPITLGRALQRY
jgi:hypothetical protein